MSKVNLKIILTNNTGKTMHFVSAIKKNDKYIYTIEHEKFILDLNETIVLEKINNESHLKLIFDFNQKSYLSINGINLEIPLEILNIDKTTNLLIEYKIENQLFKYEVEEIV